MEILEINLSATLEVALVLVAVLIGHMGIFAAVTSIILGIKYVRFNRRENSAGLTGEDAARIILDRNGLSHVKLILHPSSE